MTGCTNRLESIYVRLLKLLVLAGAVSCLFFMYVNWIGEQLIENYYLTSDYVEKMEQEYLAGLRTYVEANQVSAGDTKMLKAWVDRQKIITLEVYRDNVLLYDSEYPELKAAEGETLHASWKTYYTVDFADGTAEVSLYGLYSYQLFNAVYIGELFLAFVLFVAIVLLGIRKTMGYIRLLSREIEILESGNLDYAITVSGKDELAALARGLEEMRKSFRYKVEREAHLVQANKKIITEMSHDLRTPLTSIMLYTEIMKKNVSGQETQFLIYYIDKIADKTARIKQMAENLFAYALVAGEEETRLEEPVSLETAFYDLLSETCAYLEQNGFSVSMDLSWEEKRIRVNTDYLLRIMDNITSNLLKYADREKPVYIHTLYAEQRVGILVENTVCVCGEKEDSTGIGMGNIKNMMAKMNGVCRTEERRGRFSVALLFPFS